MRLHEITEVIGDDLSLTTRQYRSIINDLKNVVGNDTARHAEKLIQQMWSDGDRLVGNYKSLINDFSIEI